MYRILVCDDEWLVREGIVKEAEAFPELEISAVENGEEVLSVLREKQVDGLIPVSYTHLCDRQKGVAVH